MIKKLKKLIKCISRRTIFFNVSCNKKFTIFIFAFLDLLISKNILRGFKFLSRLTIFVQAQL